MSLLQPLLGISSMAPRRVLADLSQLWQARTGRPVVIEAVGGVEAAQRVKAGDEPFDVVFLASRAIDALLACGRIAPASKVDLMRSATAIAVPAGMPHPPIGSEHEVRSAMLAASRIGVSTGPSGDAVQALLARWGIAGDVHLVQAPVGIPVGQLLAEGKARLGFQQLSELVHVPGVEIVGELPAPIALETVFSAGIVNGSPHAESVRALLAFLASTQADAAKRRQGMQPLARVLVETAMDTSA